MKYLHRSLGVVPRGTKVIAELSGHQCNVILLDPVNFAAYKQGRAYEYRGGLKTKSPAVLTVPRLGEWHVIVDHGGARGHTNISLTVVPPKPPPPKKPTA